jgi:hypothetical protein
MKKNQTKVAIRLDSPRTMEACFELGVKPDELKMRTKDEFSEGAATDEILDVRYKHYLRRYNETVREVLAKKREIAKYKRATQMGQTTQVGSNIGSSTGPDMIKMDGRPSALNNVVPLTLRSLNLRNSSGNLLSPTSDMLSPASGRNPHFLTQISPQHMETYKNTVRQLKESKNSPNKIPIDLLSHTIDKTKDLRDDFDLQLSCELDKYNKLKSLKQREAIETYEEEIRRINIIHSMSVREKKRIEFEKKLKADKKKRKIENRQRLEEKIIKIKETEEVFNQKKRNQEEKIKKKLDDAKKVLQQEHEARLQHMAEQDEIKEKKRKEAEFKRKLRDEQEIERLQELKQYLERKQFESTEKYEVNMNDKLRKMRSDLDSVSLKMGKIKEMQKHNEQELFSTLVEDFTKKEENSRKVQERLKKEFDAKKAREKDKLLRFRDNMDDIKQENQAKHKELKDRFKAVEENLEAKRIEDEKNLRMKQELRQLKAAEKQDNYERNKRKLAYEQDKILARQKEHQEKLVLQKNEREFIHKTRIEVALQAKMEQDRISQSVNLMTKMLHIKDESDIKNLKGKDGGYQRGYRILEKIINPEDQTKLTPLEIIEDKKPVNPNDPKNPQQQQAADVPHMKKTI